MDTWRIEGLSDDILCQSSTSQGQDTTTPEATHSSGVREGPLALSERRLLVQAISSEGVSYRQCQVIENTIGLGTVSN